MSWERVPFESLYAIPSKNGLTRPERVRGNGYKMINMGELFAYDRIGSIDMALVPMNERELENMLVEEGDLLFARQSLVFSGAGKCSLVISTSEPTTFESHIIRVRLKKELANPAFYFYYFKSASCGIRSIVTQGVQSGIRGNDLKMLPVHLPPLDVQDKIVEILNKYNDLIENNRRRIQLLEESARLLYREWFVHLRFPGHEHVKIVDGVPEGWEKLAVEEVAYTIGGGTPSTKIPEYWDGGDVMWFSPTDLTKNDCLVLLDSAKKITEPGLNKSSAKLLPPKTILMTSRTSIGYFGLFDGVASTNQGFISLIPKEEYLRWYLLFNLRQRVDEIIGQAGGTTFKEINKTTFRAMPIIIPAKGIAEQFYDFFDDIYKQIKVIKKQTEKLIQARDLLLPRLMNGTISV